MTISRAARLAGLVAALTGSATPAVAQAYPSKPIKIMTSEAFEALLARDTPRWDAMIRELGLAAE